MKLRLHHWPLYATRMNLDLYLELWKLSDPKLIATTSTSNVYRVIYQEQWAVLKILSATGIKYESDSAKALEHFDGKGAIQLLQSNPGAILMPYAEGPTLAEQLASDAVHKVDHANESAILCSVVKQLHAPRSLTSSPHFHGLAEIFRTLIQHAEQSQGLLLKQGAKIAQMLLATERQKLVLHGDLHHQNIILFKKKSWLAIDPKGFYGERTYDLANCFFNSQSRPNSTQYPDHISHLARTFALELELDQQRILQFAFAYGCLSVCWMIEDNLDPRLRLHVAEQIMGLLE